jgi:ribonuclease HI
MTSTVDENDIDRDESSNKKRRTKLKTYKIVLDIYFDGGSRGNPGLSGSGAELRISERVLLDKSSTRNCHDATKAVNDNEAEVGSRTLHLTKFLGKNMTNNQAEYHALLLALREALHQIRCFAEYPRFVDDCIATLMVKGDSDLVIQQIRGIYRVQRQTLIPLYQEAKNLLESIENSMDCHMEFLHIPRSENTVADGECFECLSC